jgi:SAM-dependent methyltransferase
VRDTRGAGALREGGGVSAELPPAVAAFDALAPRFDERFSGWKSVAAQRRAVRRELLAVFPEGSRLLELGGGTGEDAVFLAERGRRVLMTDGAPAMVEIAARKARASPLAHAVETRRVAVEELAAFADERERSGSPPFDGAFSNFAAFNCVEDLAAAARALGRLLRPGAHALLVVFGPFSPAEALIFTLRGTPRAAFRRLSRGPVDARVGGREFVVRYPAPRAYARAFAPSFALTRVRGVGIAVPPSSAEPFVSRFSRLVSAAEALDRFLAAPLARLADHVLLDFVRTETPSSAR